MSDMAASHTNDVPGQGFRACFAAAVGMIPLALAFPLYNLWARVSSEVPLPRAIGYLAVFCAGNLALAALAGAAASWLGGWVRYARWLRPLFLLVVLGNALLIAFLALKIPLSSASVSTLLAAGAIIALAAAALWRIGERGQAAVMNGLVRLGQLLVALPLLGTPYVAYHAAHDDPSDVSLPATTPKPGAPKRIVLMTFDALRARSTSLLDPAADRTPRLAELARESDWFPRFYAGGDRTVAAVPALLSGIRPSTFFPKTANRAARIRDGSLPGIAAYLRAAGYRTYFETTLVGPRAFGMLGDFHDGDTHGVGQNTRSFNTREFVSPTELMLWMADWTKLKTVAAMDQVTANQLIIDHTLERLRGEPGPTFVWAHVGTPHRPYFEVSRQALGHHLQAGDYAPARDTQKTKDPVARKRIEGIYEEYCRFADAELGRFVAELKRAQLWGDTLLVVSADHGESFKPDRPMGHAQGTTDEDIAHIPLVVHRPGQATGRRRDEVGGHEDLVPTILGEVYPALPARLRGVPLTLATPAPDRSVYTWAAHSKYMQEGYEQTIAAYSGRFKYELNFSPAGVKQERLYDLDADPAGVRDVAAAHPEVLARLRAQVERESPP